MVRLRDEVLLLRRYSKMSQYKYLILSSILVIGMRKYDPLDTYTSTKTSVHVLMVSELSLNLDCVADESYTKSFQAFLCAVITMR